MVLWFFDCFLMVVNGFKLFCLRFLKVFKGF